MMSRVFGGHRSNPSDALRIEYLPGARPPIRTLRGIGEEKVIRTIACPGCDTHYAVYGASAFCPVCGPRPATDTVLERIEAGRRALALEDHLPADERDAARAAGVFDRFAADTVKNIVGPFEVFVRQQFNRRAANPAAAVKGKRGIFQRLDATTQLFTDYCSIDPPATVGPAVWQRLHEDFAAGTCSPTATESSTPSSSPSSPRAACTKASGSSSSGQDADRGLDDVETVVRKLAALP